MSQERKSLYHPALLREAATGREALLERVRLALGHQATPASPGPRPVVEESLVRQVAPGQELLTRWLTLARGNSMRVETVQAKELATAIDGVLAPYEIKSLLLNAGRFAASLELEKRYSARGVAVTTWGAPNCRDLAFVADASITDCRYAIADTGSLLVWSEVEFGRSSTLTAPVHLVLLPASRILPDLIDALPRALSDNGGRMPSNIVVINGPSKTADIEMHLITGVHGPKFLHVLVVVDL